MSTVSKTCGRLKQGMWFGGIVLMTGLVSCGDAPTFDPPEVRWGQDVCVECGMILSDERYAAAVVTIVQNERRVDLFDDVGEMLTSEIPGGTSRRWVRDADTKQWIDAESATYVRSSLLHTPMGFGVAAFQDASRAEATRDEFVGELLKAEDFARP